MPRIKRVAFREILRPLRMVFSTSLGSKQTIRNMLIEVVLESGATGRGEVPTSFTRPDETIPRIARTLSDCSRSLKGLPVDTYSERLRQFRREFPYAVMSISGLEVALFRASLQDKGIHEHVHWGGRLKEIETDITLPFVMEKEPLNQWIEYGEDRGFRIFKTKVSGHVKEDKAFLALVCSLLGQRGTPFALRLDGNQGYTPKDALRILDHVARKNYPVELFEQPVAKSDLTGLRIVKEGSSVPIIVDEAVETAAQLEQVIEQGCAHGVNLKVAKSGIEESAKIIGLAARAGMKLMVGCMTETMTGLSAAIHMAAGQGVFDFIDLDSIHFLHHRKNYGDISIEGPVYTIRGKMEEGCGK